jgi:hypothetical protein
MVLHTFFCCKGPSCAGSPWKPTLAVEEGKSLAYLGFSAHLCVEGLDAFKSKYDVLRTSAVLTIAFYSPVCLSKSSPRYPSHPSHPSRLIRPPFASAGGPRIFFISSRLLTTGSGFSSCEERGRPGNSGPQATFTTPHTPLKGIQALKHSNAQTLKHANPPVYAFTRNLTR